jgi:hypothetical protein
MQQHVLDDGVGALAVLDHLFEIVFQPGFVLLGFNLLGRVSIGDSSK